MEKKRIVKLGVCSLLVGLLALTACGKKTTTRKDTTAKPTTEKTTTDKVTTKENTTTESKVTTKDTIKEVKAFNVYVDGEKASTDGNNSVIEFTYLDGYDYYSHLKVKLVYTDDTEEEIDKTEYKVQTNIKSNSGCASATEPGMYSLAVSYGNFDAVNIDLVVNQKKIDVSKVAWQSRKSLSYNGEEQEVKLINVPKGVKVIYEDNKATNCGDYKAKATLSLEDDVNYYIDETSIDDLDWSISQSVASFSILDASKIYDGEGVDVKISSSISGLTPVFKFKKAGTDDVYTTSVPVDAGEYEVEASVVYTDNYIGYTTTSKFTIYKKALKVPVGNHSTDENTVVTSYTGDIQEFNIDGFDSNIMEFIEGHDDVIQEGPGKYMYIIRIKDEHQNNYVFEGYESIDELYYYWIISGDLSEYVTSINLNGEDISVSDFENLEYLHEGDVIVITAGNNYRVNSDDVGDELVYEEIIYDDLEITIFSLSELNDVYYKNIKMANEYGIDAIYIDGKLIGDNVYDGDYYYYRVAKDKETIELSFITNDLNSGILVNGIEYDGLMTININDLEDGVICVNFGENYDETLEITIINDAIIDSISVLSLATYGEKETSMIYDNYDNSCIYTKDSGTIIGLQVNFLEDYKNYTYRIVDASSRRDIDFTLLNIGDLRLTIIINDENGDYVSELDVIVYQSYFNLDGFSKFVNEDTGCTYFYKTTEESTTNLELEEFIWWDYFSLVQDNDPISQLSYEDHGVYREKLAMQAEYNGKKYTRFFFVDIIYSEKLDTYFNSVNYVIKEDDEVRRIYNGNDLDNNIILFDEEREYKEDVRLYQIEHLGSDNINYYLKAGYDLDSIEVILEDKENSQFARLVFKITVTDGVNNYTVYALGYFSGYISNNTNLYGERIVGINSLDDSISYYPIRNNRIKINDASSLSDYDIIFESECDLMIIKTDTFRNILNEKNVNEIYIRFEEEGEYMVWVNSPASSSRIFYIDVSGDFSRTLETYVEDSNVLYIDNIDEDNFIEYYNSDLEKDIMIGFYGDNSSSYISDDKVNLTVKGLALGYLYKDEGLTELIENEVEEYDVLYDKSNTPYVNIYTKNTIFYLYLSDKPIAKTKLVFGEEKYGIIRSLDDLDNPYIGDITSEDIRLYDSYNYMTLTTEKVYNDFSYSIIIPEYEDQIFEYSTYTSMEEDGILYRVTNLSTLSVDIELDLVNSPYMEIYIVPEGADDDNFDTDNFICVSIYACVNFFEIDNGTNKYYSILEPVAGGSKGEYREKTNARSTSKNNPTDPYSSYFEFYIGLDEEENIDDDGYYSFKFDSFVGGNFLYYDLDGKEKIDFDSTTGMVHFKMDKEGSGPKACIFYMIVGELRVGILLGFLN